VVAGHPVGYWTMSRTGSSEPDLSGNGHAGSYLGAPPTLASMPNGDRATDFDGVSGYLSVPSSPAFSIGTRRQLSWEGWIRPDTLQFPSGRNGYVDWMGKCERYAPTCEWEARIYNAVNAQGRCSRLSAYAFNLSAGLGSGAFWQPVCSLIRPGDWLYVVGEYQLSSTPAACHGGPPGTIDIWVDGVKWNFDAHVPTGCMSQYGIEPKAGQSPLTIGTMAHDYWFKGAIGKVALYDRLLSQSEISQRYSAMTGRQPTGTCGSGACSLG
jgi:hypothetical protein